MFNHLTNALFYGVASTYYSARNGIERARNKSWAELHKFFDTQFGVIGDDKKSTDQQLKEFQSWIYIITTTIYGRTSSVEWELKVDRGTDKEEVIHTHPLIDLLNKPNNFMTGNFLQQYSQLQLDLTGKAFIRILRNRVAPAELWPLNVSDFVRFERGTTNKDFLTGYTFKVGNGAQETYPIEDILYFRYPHPMSLIDGASPVQQMARLVDIEKYIEIYEKKFFENSARPDIILTMRDKTRGNQAENATNRVLESWRAKHQGLDKLHEPTVLANMDVTLLNATNKDFEFAALAEWDGDMLSAAYSMPKGKLFPREVNRANGFQIEVTFNRDCIMPRLDLWDTVITNGLAHEFDERLFIDHKNPVPEDTEFNLKKDESDLKNLVSPVNEIRERRGQKPVSWGKNPWAPFNLTQIDGGSGQPEPPEKPEEDSKNKCYGVPLPEKLIAKVSLLKEEIIDKYDYVHVRITFSDNSKVMGKLWNGDFLTSGKVFSVKVVDVLLTDAGPLKKQTLKNRFLDTQEKRVNYWKQFDKRTESQQPAFRKTLKKLFDAQEKDVLANLKKQAPKIESLFSGWSKQKIEARLKSDAQIIEDILFDTDEWEGKFRKGGRPHIQGAFDEAGNVVIADLGVDIDFDVHNTRADRQIVKKTQKFAKDVNNTTRKALKRELTEGFREGESIQKLSARVRSVFDTATKSRSFTIARTEIIGASNGGSVEGMKQSKVVKKKEWLTSQDDRVRDAHGQTPNMDGVQVGLNDQFSPGDGDVPYPQSVNERCSVIPVL